MMTTLLNFFLKGPQSWSKTKLVFPECVGPTMRALKGIFSGSMRAAITGE